MTDTMPDTAVPDTMTDTAVPDTMTGAMTDTMTGAMTDTMTGTMTGTGTTTVEVFSVGRLREVLGSLSDDTELNLGVVDHHHFNTLLFAMSITSARVLTSPGVATLILHVPTFSGRDVCESRESVTYKAIKSARVPPPRRWRSSGSEGWGTWGCSTPGLPGVRHRCRTSRSPSSRSQPSL